MVVAAQPAVLDHAIGQIRPAVGALAVYKTVTAALIPVEDQILAEQAHGLGGARV